MNNNPAIPFFLVILLGIGLVFLLASYGADQMNNETVDQAEGTDDTEQVGNGGEETGEEAASAGDFDPESFARDNCAACHGQDFTGGMGPDLHGVDQGDFITAVREGPGSMPAFPSDQITDEELEILAAHFE